MMALPGRGAFSRWLAENKPRQVGPVSVLVREWNGCQTRFQVFEVFDGTLNEGRFRKFGVRWPIRQTGKGQGLVYKTVYVTAESPEEALQIVVGKTGEDGFPSFSDELATVVRGRTLPGGGAEVTLEHPGGQVETRRFGPEARVLVDGKPATWDDVYLGWEWIAGGRWADGNVQLDLQGQGGAKRTVSLPPGTKITVDGSPATWRDVKAKMMVREEGSENGTSVLHLHRDPGGQHREMQVAVKDGPGGPVLDFTTEPSSYMRHSHGGTLGELGKYYDKIASRPDKRGGGRMTKGWARDQLKPQVFDLDDADKVMGQLDFTDEHRHKPTPKKYGGVYDADDLAVMARSYMRLAKPLAPLKHRLDALLSDRRRSNMDETRIQLIQRAWGAFRDLLEASGKRREQLFRHIKGGYEHDSNKSILTVPPEIWARNADDARDFDPEDPKWDVRNVEDEGESAYIAKFLCEMVFWTHRWIKQVSKDLYAKVLKREGWHSKYLERSRPVSPEAAGDGEADKVGRDSVEIGMASEFSPTEAEPGEAEYKPGNPGVVSRRPRPRVDA